MNKEKIKTKLVEKKSNLINVCTNCNYCIQKNENYYFEIGINAHLHSLISRRFCSSCYSKISEKKLLGK